MLFNRREASRSVLAAIIGGALLLVLAPANVVAQASQPNILLILMDDVGLEHLDFYAIGEQGFAATLNLTDFAEVSRVFFDAWSSPLCSPTRALLMTGRHAFRTGLGGLIPCDAVYGLDTTDPYLLAKQLKDPAAFGPGDSTYATAAFGKWHLGKDSNTPAGCEGKDTPIDAGFDLYDGWFVESYEGGPWLYDDYIRTRITTEDVADNCIVDPDTEIVDGYQTDDMTDRMITWIQQQEQNENEPWFVYAAYSAAHAPYHCPPTASYPGVTFDCTAASDDRTKYRAMIKALDHDLGELFSEINMSNTLVIVASDNGSPAGVAAEPVDGDNNRAKGTVFQGGIRVPLIIGGLDLEEDAIGGGKPVGLIDLYATILSAANATLPAECDDPSDIDGCTDSVDLSPYFYDVAPQPLPRTFLYTEWFYPNFEPGTGAGPTLAQQAIRNTQYKYVQVTTGLQGLFRISPDTEDPWEEENLISSSWEEHQTSLGILQDALEDLVGPGSILNRCTGLAKVGEDCLTGTDCCSRVCSSATLKCVNPFPPVEPGCP